MSTDVYFDFHSLEGWALMVAADTADNTNGRAMPLYEKWWAFRKAAKGAGGPDRHYDVCRVAYLSNLVARCTYDLWRAFEERWGGKVVTEDTLPTIVADWRVLYDLTQAPENAEDCYMPDDFSTPEAVEEDLRAHLGFILDTRVD